MILAGNFGRSTMCLLFFAKVKIKVLRGHLDSVNSCQFFENDTRVLSSSNDQTVRIWVRKFCMYIRATKQGQYL